MYTVFRLYGLRIYGLFGFISVIWSMVNQVLVVNFSDTWSFRLYGQLYQDKTVDHISETLYKVCLISPGTDLPGEWALLALGSFPGLLRQTLLRSIILGLRLGLSSTLVSKTIHLSNSHVT